MLNQITCNHCKEESNVLDWQETDRIFGYICSPKCNVEVDEYSYEIQNNRNQYILKAVYLGMMYVARCEDVSLEEKYYELEYSINELHDISLTDMIDNIDTFYRFIYK